MPTFFSTRHNLLLTSETGTQPQVQRWWRSLKEASYTSASPAESPDQVIIWRFSTAWYDSARDGSVWQKQNLTATFWHSEEDPLARRGIHKVNFPHWRKLAQKYLCVPATSTPSERLFSTSGNVVTFRRHLWNQAKWTCWFSCPKICNDFSMNAEMWPSKQAMLRKQ